MRSEGPTPARPAPRAASDVIRVGEQYYVVCDSSWDRRCAFDKARNNICRSFAAVARSFDVLVLNRGVHMVSDELLANQTAALGRWLAESWLPTPARAGGPRRLVRWRTSVPGHQNCALNTSAPLGHRYAAPWYRYGWHRFGWQTQLVARILQTWAEEIEQNPDLADPDVIVQTDKRAAYGSALRSVCLQGLRRTCPPMARQLACEWQAPSRVHIRQGTGWVTLPVSRGGGQGVSRTRWRRPRRRGLGSAPARPRLPV